MKTNVKSLSNRVSAFMLAYVLVLGSVNILTPFLFNQKASAFTSWATILVAKPSATSVAYSTGTVTIDVAAPNLLTGDPILVDQSPASIIASVADDGLVSTSCSGPWASTATVNFISTGNGATTGQPAATQFCYKYNGLTIDDTKTITFTGNFTGSAFSPIIIEQKITVFDNQAPVIESHADVNVPAASASGANVTYAAPNVTDNFDDDKPATCLPASGSLFKVGTTEVTCNAMDSKNNPATPTKFNVIVTDQEKPVISLKGLPTVTIEAGEDYAEAGATASDNVDGDISADILATRDFTTTNHIGSYKVSYNVSDLNGNPAETIFRVVNIVPRKITITADNSSKIYGLVDPALTYKITSGTLMTGDDFTGLLDRDSGEDVAVYQIKKGTLDLGPDYTIDFVGADFEITKKPITITAQPKTKVYGEADPELTYEYPYTDLVGGDVFAGSLIREAGEGVGTYDIGQGSLNNTNYDIDFVTAELSITPKPIAVIADAKTRLYGEADPVFTYTALGLLDGDILAGSLGRVAGNDVGAYKINQGTLANSNYSISFTDADMTINPAKITITADSKTKIFGAVDPELTYKITFGNLVNGDLLAGSLTRVVGELAGQYQIKIGSLANANYSISYIPGVFTISPAPIVAPEVTTTAAVATTGEVAGATDNTYSEQGTVETGEDASAGTATADENSDVKGASDKKVVAKSVWKFIGLAWYWWLLILATIAAALWLFIAKRRTADDK